MQKSGFTLAEVLLTLAIIGIVAALTIPSLLSSVGNNQTVTTLKKNLSSFDQVTKQIAMNNSGTLVDMATDDSSLLNTFATYMSFSKICTLADGAGNCWHGTAASSIKNLGGGDGNHYAAGGTRISAIKTDGTLVIFDPYNATAKACNSTAETQNGLNNACMFVRIDVNGFKEPNTNGRDIFDLILTKDGRTVARGVMNTSGYSATYNNCNPSSNTLFSGHACAGRIMLEDGMKY